jgi:hypothetical protein
MSEVDFADVQGLVRFGYKDMTRASYALLRVKDPAAARDWLRTAPITSAVAMNPPPKTALHVAFTAAGLRALGVAETVVAGFSHEFREGMAQESRARQLGDVETNDPKGWDWGGPGNEPHLVQMFFAEPTVSRLCWKAPPTPPGSKPSRFSASSGPKTWMVWNRSASQMASVSQRSIGSRSGRLLTRSSNMATSPLR